jgi:hypothetical protein
MRWHKVVLCWSGMVIQNLCFIVGVWAPNASYIDMPLVLELESNVLEPSAELESNVLEPSAWEGYI